MISSCRWLRYPLIVLASLVLLACVEKVGRRFPSVMPVQWQRMHAGIVGHAAYRPVLDPEIGFLTSPGPGTDRNGFPNTDPWPDRAEIVFLGDSLLTNGVQIPAKFTSLVGQLLPGEPVINLGLPGAGLERQALVFRRFGVPLRPRIVVACLFLTSDFGNDQRFRTWVRNGRREPFYGYRMPDDYAYVSPFARLRRLDWTLLEESWVYVKARDQATLLVKGPDALTDRQRFPDGTETFLDLEGVRFANAQVDANDPRLDALMESLGRMRALVRSHDATLVVMLLPTFEELFRVEPAAESGNILAHTRARLKAAKYTVLDMYPALREAGRLQTPFLINDNHLNAYGNQIVAHEFVAWLQRHRALDDI